MDLLDVGQAILSHDQCVDLVAGRSVGRVAISVGALPAVVPVNYVVLDGDVAFLTRGGTSLWRALRDTVVAFEVDDFDAADETGWSVLLIGRSEVLADPALLHGLRHTGLRAWPSTRCDHVVRIHPELVSGCRVTPARGPDQALPPADVCR